MLVMAKMDRFVGKLFSPEEGTVSAGRLVVRVVRDNMYISTLHEHHPHHQYWRTAFFQG
jgi:hypothetical protein